LGVEQRPPVKLDYAEPPVEKPVTKPVTKSQVVGVILFYVGAFACIFVLLYVFTPHMRMH
jgi:hypothetical protein